MHPTMMRSLYQWDTSGMTPDCVDGVCTWTIDSLAYLEGGEFDLMVYMPWIGSPWVVSLAIEPSSGDDYPADNQIEITVASSEPPLGDPGTVYQYADTIGILGEPYPIDDQHYSNASGLGIDASDNLLHGRGNRIPVVEESPKLSLLRLGGWNPG